MAQHKKKKSGFSIKYKMILGIGIPLILVLSVIGVILLKQTVSTVENLKKSEIELQTLKDMNFGSLYIVDCPLDRQVEIEQGLNNEELLTAEEVLEALAEAEKNADY